MIDLGTFGGDAQATHVNGRKVVGWFIADDVRTFLWTVGRGMVDVTPPDFSRAQPVGIDAGGRIAVTNNFTGHRIARSAVLVFSQDTDGDGLPDTDDNCPDSLVSLTVVIEDCDSGAPNTIFPNGCTISDNIQQCASSAQHHGPFVSCVAHLTNDLKRRGVITAQEQGAIQRCATQSNIP
jgi:hypothetical protein